MHKNILLSLIFVFALSCEHVPQTPVSQTPEPWAQPPNRVLLLLVDGLPQWAFSSNETLRALKSRSHFFPEAYLGHAFTLPAIAQMSFLVSQTPRTLGVQDMIARPAGKKCSLLSAIGQISPSPETKTFFSAIKIENRRQYAVGGDGTEPGWLSRGELEKRTTASNAETTDQILKIFQLDSEWRSIVGHYGGIKDVLQRGGTLDDAIERFAKDWERLRIGLERFELASDTLVVITSTTPPIAMETRDAFFFDKAKKPLPPELPGELTPIIKTEKVACFAANGDLRFWLKNSERVFVAKFANSLRTIESIAEIYTRQMGDDAHYIRIYRHPKLSGKELEWAEARHSGLLEETSGPAGPDVIAILKQSAVAGVWGGAQESQQHIPLLLHASYLQPPAESDKLVRLIDIAPIMTRILKGTVPEKWEGTSGAIESVINNPR